MRFALSVMVMDPVSHQLSLCYFVHTPPPAPLRPPASEGVAAEADGLRALPGFKNHYITNCPDFNTSFFSDEFRHFLTLCSIITHLSIIFYAFCYNLNH